MTLCLWAGTHRCSSMPLLRPIESIDVGDEVLAWDPETGETTTQTVTALIRPEPKLIWRLEARDADGEAETFEVTDDHPWYVEGGGWVETQNLLVGHRIETADDRGLTILATTDRLEHAYNLEVASPHTFLVGDDGAVVHNNNCLRLLQAGGRTIRQATARALGLERATAGRALEALKRAERLPPNFHGRIMSNGDYVNPQTGQVIGNIFDYVP